MNGSNRTKCLTETTSAKISISSFCLELIFAKIIIIIIIISEHAISLDSMVVIKAS
jgi:hypothetical protein